MKTTPFWRGGGHGGRFRRDQPFQTSQPYQPIETFRPFRTITSFSDFSVISRNFGHLRHFETIGIPLSNRFVQTRFTRDVRRLRSNSMANTTKQLTGIDRQKLDRFRAEMAKLGVKIPEGDDVEINAMFGVKMHATYEEAIETLTLELIDKPIFVPESQVWSFIDSGASKIDN